MSIAGVMSQRQNSYAVSWGNSVPNRGAVVTETAKGNSSKAAGVEVSISPGAQKLFEQSRQVNATAQADTDNIENDAKYQVPEMKPGVLYNVDKWIDTHMSSSDKTAIGFPFPKTSNDDTSMGLRSLAQAIIDRRKLGYLNGPLTKQYLTDEGPYGIGNIKKWPQFQNASGQDTVGEILRRVA